MSLDVFLTNADGEEVYSANITHNLQKMADEAGIYQCIWRPEECGIERASGLIQPLAAGVALLATDRKRFAAFESPNGWGLYDNFLPWCCRYLEACRDYPDATVGTWR